MSKIGAERVVELLMKRGKTTESTNIGRGVLVTGDDIAIAKRGVVIEGVKISGLTERYNIGGVGFLADEISTVELVRGWYIKGRSSAGNLVYAFKNDLEYKGILKLPASKRVFKIRGISRTGFWDIALADSGVLSIGCKKHRIGYWRKNWKVIASDNYKDDWTRDIYTETVFLRLLDLLEEKLGELQKGLSASKKKSGGRKRI